jgi:hypothetical protein
MMFRKLKNWCGQLGGNHRPAATPTVVRPTLEVLEDRAVPASVVADFPGQGLFRYDTKSQSTQLLDGYDPAAFAVDRTTGDVVATFPGVGTALWTPNTGWLVLTHAEAYLLSISGSDQNIVGDFSGYGVWEYHPNAGWLHLTPADAYDLQADAAGNVVAEFSGYGVWYFSAQTTSWAHLTPVDASRVIMGNVGLVLGEFPGYGVWANQFGGNWSQLTGVDAVSLAGSGAGGMIAASFANSGTFAYVLNTHSWLMINSGVVYSLATDGTDFSGDFYDPFDGSNFISFYDSQVGGQWVAISSFQGALSGIGAG